MGEVLKECNTFTTLIEVVVVAGREVTAFVVKSDEIVGVTGLDVNGDDLGSDISDGGGVLLQYGSLTSF